MTEARSQEGGTRILVVDDTPQNVKLLADLLGVKGYIVSTAADGEEGLAKVASEKPDLVLLDVMMPGLSGYDVCRRMRDNPDTALLPVVLVTALDPKQERVKGMEAGADDFLSKPIQQAELFARVKSLLRVKALQDEVKRQADELRDFNARLEQRVSEQVAQLERLGRLKNFFSPQVAEAIVAGGGEELLKPHRREVPVVFTDLRGFTAFTDEAEPEEVMEMLNGYHAEMGRLINEREGTLEHFAGDGMMIFFNDPVPMERPAEHAARMALEMQAAFVPIAEAWKKRGYSLGLGIGIATGFATLGAIGFEGRWDYAVIGSVANLSARLCGEAKSGEILVERKTLARLDALARTEEAGELTLKGFAKAIPAFRLLGLDSLPA
jgi:class 3 adenylate cyclase/CheY-like chemotaxis protein